MTAPAKVYVVVGECAMKSDHIPDIGNMVHRIQLHAGEDE
jgi:hypothetical protein